MDNDNKVNQTDVGIIDNENIEDENLIEVNSENLPEEKAEEKEDFSHELTAKDFIPKKEVHNEVRLFLDNELETLHKSKSEVQAYNIEKEFAETKKHKSPLALILLAICFVVVLSTVIVMTAIITKKDKDITVEMKVFDDLNLKNLLDTVAKVQENYDNAVKNRTTLLNDKEVELRDAQSKLEQDTFLIKSLKLSGNEEKNRLAKVNKEYESSLKKIDDSYNPRIKALETEIESYENQLKEYDASKIEAAQEQEKIINSERRVQELERRKLSQQYEDRIAELEQTIELLRSSKTEDVYRSVETLSGKYQAEINGLDPKLHDITAEDLIAEAKENVFTQFDSASSAEIISDETAAKGFEQFQNAYDSYSYLDNVVASLPQKNSIPSYVKASRNFVNSMGQTFTDTTVALQNDKLDLTNQVGKLEKRVGNLSDEVDGLTEEYNLLVDEYNVLVDSYEELNDTFETEKEEITSEYENKLDELAKQSDEEKENLKNSMLADFSKESKNQKDFFETCISGIITNSKSMAAVISAESKDKIMIYVTPEIKSIISKLEVPAEIKAAKSIKGTIVSDNEYFRFIPSKDKNGNVVDFDLSTVTPGVIVKLTVKK